MKNDLRRWISMVEATDAYHGSAVDSPAFVMGHQGDNAHTFGAYRSTRWGIFFSDNPKFANLYGKVGKYRLDIHKTLDMDADRGEIVHAFMDTLDAFDAVERPLFLAAKNIASGTWRTWQIFENDLGQRFVTFLKARGFDSAGFAEDNTDDGGEWHESHTIVVFDPSAVSRN